MNKTKELGKTVGIYGTPTFFINNKPLVGPKTYEELRDDIEAELQ